jgi:uncharacterized protein
LHIETDASVVMSDDVRELVLTALIFVAAMLYACVGHGGASGYLASMALVGIPVGVMRPSALALNILVSLIATWKFIRVGAFSHRLFWPLALASVPLAFVGGTLDLPTHLYRPLVGAVLIFAAWQSYRTAAASAHVAPRVAAIWVLVLVGAALGFLSGLTGVGGGIFLSPVLILRRWASTKVVSGIAAAFILVNSLAGLAGIASRSMPLSFTLVGWAAAALVGGYLGAEFGSRRLGNPVIQRLLSVVLLVAGLKMIATA